MAGVVAWAGPAAAAETGRWSQGYIPNVPVVNQDGKALRFYDDVIKGKIVVISFIYTSCQDICPLVTARLTQVQEKLGDAAGRDIHFISISIDPETDTPARLKEHANAFHVGAGWHFLTGKKDDIDQIRFKLGERSRKLTEHHNTILLGNDRTGEWAQDSAFFDISTVTTNIRSMDPDWRMAQGRTDVTQQAGVTPARASDLDLPGQALFIKTCASCHTIGKGDRVGPDLSGLSQRRDRAWLISYMTSPQRMRQQQDPTALELSKKYYPVRMPNLSLSDYDASDLIAYVEAMTYAASSAANGKPAHDHGGHDHSAHAGHGAHQH